MWNRWQLQGVAKVVRQHGEMRLSLLPTDTDLERVLPEDLDGVIGSLHPQQIGELQRRGIHTINFTRHVEAPVGGEIWTDYDELIRMAVSHLEERGCTRFACLSTENPTMRNQQDMVTAFSNVLDEKKLLNLGRFRSPASGLPWTLPRQVQEIADWLQDLPAPFALVCTDSIHAGRALEAARAAGLSVPGHFRLLSLDNDSSYLECCTPTVTHMQLSQIEKGEWAARHLIEVINGTKESVFRIQKKPGGVIPGQSTAYTAPSDPGLQKALSLLEHWEYTCPRVEDMAKAAGMSRSTLFRRLQAEIGKNPGDLLYQSRREKALLLLRDPHIRLAEVADRCGYSLPSQLTHDIKKHTGKTPKAYRLGWQM